MTLLVRDEIDLVADNLEHHFDQGIDHVIATDNGSVDGTRKVLDTYRRRGRLTLLDEPGRNFDQHRWVTRMAHLAAGELGADWVVNNDADEFWFGRDGVVADELARVPDDVGVVVAHRTNFLLVEDDGRPWQERLTVRLRDSVHHPGFAPGALPPKVAHRASSDVRVLQGNHEVDSPTLGRALDDGRLSIVHAPARTWEQFEQSIRIRGEAYARNTELPIEVGHIARSLYARLNEDAAAVRTEIVVTATDLEAGLASGEYVVDTRLRDSIAARSARRPASLFQSLRNRRRNAASARTPGR